MLRYTLRRVLQAIPMLFIIAVLCFALIQLAPYDAIDTLTQPNMSPEVIEAIKARSGLDKPAHIQFINWLKRMAVGDLGYSLINHQSVATDLLARLPNTLLLVLPSYILALLISVVLGLVAGANRGRPIDKAIDAFCAFGMATPTFWIGMLLIYVFAYRLNLVPVLGMYTLGAERTTSDLIWHMILPCTVLTFGFLPDIIRFVRSSTITQMKEDYVMVQQAFGAPKAQILVRHVMKNALLPIITLVGMSLPMLITGAFITESIFSWPGVGTYFLQAIKAFDYPVIMSVMLFSAVAVIVGNLLSDITYGLVDPRIKAMR